MFTNLREHKIDEQVSLRELSAGLFAYLQEFLLGHPNGEEEPMSPVRFQGMILLLSCNMNGQSLLITEAQEYFTSKDQKPQSLDDTDIYILCRELTPVQFLEIVDQFISKVTRSQLQSVYDLYEQTFGSVTSAASDLEKNESAPEQ